MALKGRKKSAFIQKDGLRVNCDGTTIKDRKPNLKIMPNHRKFIPSRKVIR